MAGTFRRSILALALTGATTVATPGIASVVTALGNDPVEEPPNGPVITPANQSQIVTEGTGSEPHIHD